MNGLQSRAECFLPTLPAEREIADTGDQMPTTKQTSFGRIAKPDSALLGLISAHPTSVIVFFHSPRRSRKLAITDLRISSADERTSSRRLGQRSSVAAYPRRPERANAGISR